MKKISEKDLAQLRTKGGVTVKRRFGTAKSSEPEAKEATAPILELLQTVIANNTKAIEQIGASLAKPEQASAVALKSESILPPRELAKKLEKVELPPIQSAPKRAEVVPISLKVIKQIWSYAVNRDKQGRMSEAVALAKSGRKVVFNMRREEGLITNIEISDGAKAKRLLGISRGDDNLIDGVQENVI